MKIICIGRNYVEHAHELGNSVPESPVIFMKPETALVTQSTVVLPSFSNDVHYELELVVKISKTASGITVNEAEDYHEEWALGIDFTARDVQSELKSKGLPWEKAKAFDQSAYVSSFFSKNIWTPETYFYLQKNDVTVQKGDIRNMIFSINELIADASKYFTLQPGDLIFTGTPQGVGKVSSGDSLKGYRNQELMFDITIV